MCVCLCSCVSVCVCVIVQNSRAVASPVRPALAPFGCFWASPSQGQATFIANDKKRKTRTQFLWFHFGRFLFAERFKLLTAVMPQFISFGFRSGIQKYLQDARTCLINRNLFQAKLMVTPFGHFSLSRPPSFAALSLWVIWRWVSVLFHLLCDGLGKCVVWLQRIWLSASWLLVE